MSLLKDGKKYIIMNVASGTVVDLYGGDGNDNAKISGYKLNMNADPNLQKHQIWHADNVTGDYYVFSNVKSGTNMDNCAGSSIDGNPVIGYHSIDDDKAQQWWPIKVGGSHRTMCMSHFLTILMILQMLTGRFFFCFCSLINRAPKDGPENLRCCLDLKEGRSDDGYVSSSLQQFPSFESDLKLRTFLSL